MKEPYGPENLYFYFARHLLCEDMIWMSVVYHYPGFDDEIQKEGIKIILDFNGTQRRTDLHKFGLMRALTAFNDSMTFRKFIENESEHLGVKMFEKDIQEEIEFFEKKTRRE